MKRALSLLLIAAWAGAGCESLPRIWEEPKASPAAPVTKKESPKPALTADQITETNAQAAADALDSEISRDVK